ncbi:peptidoglycan-binding protein [Kitasatospora hibisci]|uniref:peptidoglycan-binding protein n=1 Tax=Kitasatospora hibisci TaxID=3369522 RepID=UPI003755222A
MTRTERPTPLLEFDEVEPDEDCICPGCSARRRARLHAAPVHEGGHAAARSLRRRAAVLVAAASTAFAGGAAGAAAAPAPGDSSAPTTTNPQGGVTGPYGGEAVASAATADAAAPVTRAQIIERAQNWVNQKVPYSMSRYWTDGYRQDCSGFVSMAWGLGSSQTTWTLIDFAERIGKADLQPGDVLVYNNPANPQAGSHVTIFGGWTNTARTRYLAYEQTAPGTTKRDTPYAYWSDSASYVPYRLSALSPGTSSDGASSTAFPGADRFGPGADNAYVTELGRLLVQRGGGRFYTDGPGPRWGESDRRATEAFQLAQGWRGSEADGLPGKDTWDYLVNHKGRDIAPATPPPPPPAGPGVPAFPGRDRFGPGADNDDVRRLGEQLVRKGFGGFYTEGPGPRWSESDRRCVQAFQEAQGWHGDEADGLPGPDTWARLFS